MKKIIFILAACLLTVSASASDALRLNRHQQKLMKQIEQKQAPKAIKSANASAKSAGEIASVLDYIDLATLDSVVYSKNGLNIYKYDIVRDGSQNVSQITEYLSEDDNNWQSYCRYDISRSEASLAVELAYWGETAWEPSVKYTYYDEADKEFYLLQSYEDGQWVNTYSRERLVQEGGVVSHVITIYSEGQALVVGRIDFTYEGENIVKIEYFEEEGGQLALIETDQYIYSESGELTRIESADWYESFTYSAAKTESYIYSKTEEGTFVKTEYDAIENTDKEYFEYAHEEYDVTGEKTVGEYRVRVEAQQGFDEILKDTYYDCDQKAEVLDEYIGIVYDAEGRIVNLSAITMYADKPSVERTQLFGYLDDGRIKYTRTLDYDGNEVNAMVYYYADSQDNPTGIESVMADASEGTGIVRDLTGRVVNSNYRGIVIINGKKVVR